MKVRTARFSPLALCLVVMAFPLQAEILSIQGTPAKWMDIVQAPLRDLHPTQISIGFDQVYYKLGRYAQDPRKIFDEYCEVNGQGGVRDYSLKSTIRDTSSFTCREMVGSHRGQMKTAVIAPDGRLYLTDGHHIANTYWHMVGAGPDMKLHLIISRDYREFTDMDDFWKQMEVEKNAWFYDAEDKLITPKELPLSFGLNNFKNDSYRSLMFFTRRIVWNNPGRITVPEPATYEDRYPSIPFVEFYWAREIRPVVNLAAFDLNTRSGYLAAIQAVGEAIMAVRIDNVGGSGHGTAEMGQFHLLNQKERFRILRPGTGKLDVMLKAKADPAIRPAVDQPSHIGALTKP